ITQTLDERIASWPEDTPFNYSLPVTKAKSGSVNIGKIETSTHIGTHIDAPFHFDDDGIKVDELNIDRYIGDAAVIEVMDKKEITAEDLKASDISGTILLIKTKGEADREYFPPEVPVLSKGAVDYIAQIGIKLFGVDVLSVDDIDSKTLDIHHKLHQNDIMIIENVVLEDVRPGLYDFIALPLKIKDADGSPVRAAIRPKGEGRNE